MKSQTEHLQNWAVLPKTLQHIDSMVNKNKQLIFLETSEGHTEPPVCELLYNKPQTQFLANSTG